jgi:hypothetical protein
MRIDLSGLSTSSSVMSSGQGRDSLITKDVFGFGFAASGA